jgi:toxin ParE1/3/4
LSTRLKLSGPARADLLEIWCYTAEGSVAAADRLLDRIHKRCNALTRMPRQGRLRPELGPELRSVPVGRYLIFYRETPRGVEVVRVRGGEMDLARLFEQ